MFLLFFFLWEGEWKNLWYYGLSFVYTLDNANYREDAEMEYLRVAQDLEMYGIQYYPICVS